MRLARTTPRLSGAVEWWKARNTSLQKLLTIQAVQTVRSQVTCAKESSS
jgi:hypothetical protein